MVSLRSQTFKLTRIESQDEIPLRDSSRIPTTHHRLNHQRHHHDDLHLPPVSITNHRCLSTTFTISSLPHHQRHYHHDHSTIAATITSSSSSSHHPHHRSTPPSSPPSPSSSTSPQPPPRLRRHQEGVFGSGFSSKGKFGRVESPKGCVWLCRNATRVRLVVQKTVRVVFG
nr:hypothetical protein [Tanacetum cinerariifolium]